MPTVTTVVGLLVLGMTVPGIDDGLGMSEVGLLAAMRVRSCSPTEDRELSDLGRYGLGLKTASISQSRSLTVATHCSDGLGTNIRRWDIDHLVSTGEWQLLRVEPDDGMPSLDALLIGCVESRKKLW